MLRCVDEMDRGVVEICVMCVGNIYVRIYIHYDIHKRMCIFVCTYMHSESAGDGVLATRESQLQAYESAATGRNSRK
jgi:hypothetical protein